MSISSLPPGPDPCDPATILLRPKAGSSATPPEDLGQELEAWDTLFEVIRTRRQMQFWATILVATRAKSFDEILMLDSRPEDDYFPDLEESD